MTREAIAQGRRARHLAGVVDTVLFRGRQTVGRASAGDRPRRPRARSCSGSDQIERGVPTQYYNAAFLVRPDGTTAGVYRKMHLVPFGEYVPLQAAVLLCGAARRSGLRFLARRTRRCCCRSSGHLSAPRSVTRSSTRISCGISCAGGSELLTTITNDAWFGRTSAPYQHFAQASMRAIENGRYLVRAANTGISGIVDPYGRVLAASRIFEPAVIVGEARFLRATHALHAHRRRCSPTLSALVTARPLVVCCVTMRRIVYNELYADCRRSETTLRGSQQARRRSAELSLKPPDPTKN